LHLGPHGARIEDSQRHRPVRATTADAVPEPEDKASQPKSSGTGKVLALGAVVTLGAAAAALYSSGQTAVIKDFILSGPLGRSGFMAAFSLIFLSEIGDKTFFIAALLAMRLGRWIAFAGSVSALAAMTVISVGIGAVFRNVPDALKSSLPIGEIAGIALLVYFGIKALKAATEAEPTGGSEDELADAQEAVQEAESSGKVSRQSTWGSLVEVAGLIFLAEWGDRSMLATIALGAAQNPVGVAIGATVGHAAATAIAVLGGALAGKYVSERSVNMASGVLFLLFAAATAYTMF